MNLFWKLRAIKKYWEFRWTFLKDLQHQRAQHVAHVLYLRRSKFPPNKGDPIFPRGNKEIDEENP